MSKYDIDEGTGLPKLPEGHFWRVGREQVEIRKELPPGQWEKTSARLFTEVYRDLETREVVIRPKGLFRKEKTICEYRYTNRTEGIVFQQSKKTGVISRNYSTYRGEYSIEEREQITKENLLPLCEKAMEKMEALNLYGDYPPKKFEA